VRTTKAGVTIEDMPTTPGWADSLGRQLSGDPDTWQRMRSSGARPYRICGDDVVAKAKRGAKNGGGNRRYEMRKLDAALGKPEEIDE
jgi:hypothetical protein